MTKIDKKLDSIIKLEFERLLSLPEYSFHLTIRSRFSNEKKVAESLGFPVQEVESGVYDIVLGTKNGIIPVITSYEFGGATDWVQFSEPKQIQK